MSRLLLVLAVCAAMFFGANAAFAGPKGNGGGHKHGHSHGHHHHHGQHWGGYVPWYFGHGHYHGHW